MKTKQYFTFTVIAAVISLGIPAAIAGLSFYTDRGDWEAAVSGDIVMENFNAVTPSFLTEGVNHTGLIDIEMLDLSESNKFNAINDGSGYSNVDGTPYYRGRCFYADPDAVINLVLPSPVSAFGGDFTSIYSHDGLVLEVNGLQYAFSDRMSSDDGTGFLGFISENPFSTITLFDPVKTDLDKKIYRGGESFGLDNVSFVATPEPITMVLLGVGGFLLRKRRKVQNI